MAFVAEMGILHLHIGNGALFAMNAGHLWGSRFVHIMCEVVEVVLTISAQISPQFLPFAL